MRRRDPLKLFPAGRWCEHSGGSWSGLIIPTTAQTPLPQGRGLWIFVLPLSPPNKTCLWLKLQSIKQDPAGRKGASSLWLWPQSLPVGLTKHSHRHRVFKVFPEMLQPRTRIWTNKHEWDKHIHEYIFLYIPQMVAHVYIFLLYDLPLHNEQKSQRFFHIVGTTLPSLRSKAAERPLYRRPQFTEAVPYLPTFISVFCFNRQACSEHPRTDGLKRITALFWMPASRAVRILHNNLFNGSLF